MNRANSSTPNNDKKQSKSPTKKAASSGSRKKADKIGEDEDGGSTSATTKNNKFGRERSLPVTKVRHIMECSPNSDELKITGEAVSAMARATEAFVELLARGAQTQSPQNHSRIAYNDISQFVECTEKLAFIQDILPRKQKYAEVLKLIRKNSKRL